jgi:hypothetical protein
MDTRLCRRRFADLRGFRDALVHVDPGTGERRSDSRQVGRPQRQPPCLTDTLRIPVNRVAADARRFRGGPR